MANNIIDLTRLASPPPSAQALGPGHTEHEIIDLTGDSDSEDGNGNRAQLGRVHIPQSAGSFDQFLLYLNFHRVVGSLSSRQIERLRERWTILNDSANFGGSLDDDSLLQARFSPDFSVIEAREILTAMRQMAQDRTPQGRRPVAGTFSGGDDSIPLTTSSPSATSRSDANADRKRQRAGVSVPLPFVLRSGVGAVSKSDQQRIDVDSGPSERDNVPQQGLGSSRKSGNSQYAGAIGELDTRSASQSQAAITVKLGAKSDHSTARHNALMNEPNNSDQSMTANVDPDARASPPRTPQLDGETPPHDLHEAGSSQTRNRDIQGRFTDALGSAKTASPPSTKRAGKRANETELLKENLMHGNFKPAPVSAGSANGSSVDRVGLRSATRARSSPLRTNDSDKPTEAGAQAGLRGDEQIEPLGYDVDCDYAGSGSEPPPLVGEDTNEDDCDAVNEEPSGVLRTLEAVEHALLEHAREMAEDHEYYSKHYLAAARTSLDASINGGQTHVSYIDTVSPFAGMRAIETFGGLAAGHDNIVQRMAQSVHSTSKGPKAHGPSRSVLSAPVTSFKAAELQVPFYTHYVSTASNFRAENCDKLLYAPYFHDDQEQTPDLKGLETHLNHEYKNLTEKRSSYVQLLHKVTKWKPYLAAFLQEIDCGEGDVLRYLLQPDAQPMPDLGLDRKDLQLWIARDTLRKEDFDTEHPKWRAVFKNLPQSTDKGLAYAGLACHAFRNVTKFNIWHIVRRSSTVDRAAQCAHPVSNADALAEIQSALCRICHRLNCPYHGLNKEEDASTDEASDASSDDEVDSTSAKGSSKSSKSDLTDDEDSIFRGYYSSDEEGINDERPVLAPKHKRARSPLEQHMAHSRRNFDHGRWIEKGVTNMMHMRKPFWPCDHEGSCESKKCRCWREGITCEKACGCSSACKRRFPGCTCAQRGKPCHSEGKCPCRALNRECDADLCGSCGVREVLDPVNRYDDDVLAGRCHNASIQRDRPKNTKVGVSQVVGCGLYSCEDIPAGACISEYKGEVCGHQEGERRGVTNGYRPNNYLFTVSGSTYDVDSMHYGNKTRFINNSQNPRNINVEAKLKLCNMVVRIGMFATRDIKAGEELFFNYGYEKVISDTFWEPGEAPKEKTLGRIGAASSKRKSKAKAQLSTRATPASRGPSPHEARNAVSAAKARARRNRLDEIPQDDENDIDYRPSSQTTLQTRSFSHGAVYESGSDGEHFTETPNGRHRLPRSAQTTPRSKFITKESWDCINETDDEDENDEYRASDGGVDATSEMDPTEGTSDDNLEILRGRKRKRTSRQ